MNWTAIEDIVDDLVLCLSSNTRNDKKPEKHPIRSYLSNHAKGTIPHQIGNLQSKLKHLGILIEKILSTRVINSLQAAQTSGKRNTLFNKTSIVLGTSRDRTMLDIVSELTSQHSKSCGVSIIGMDGLGKTSLARTILDDEITKNHFPLVLSACVSGPFQVTDVVKKLVEDHSRRTATHPQPIESYQYDDILKGILGSNNCLLVLDDLWSLTYNDWDIFKSNYLTLCPRWKILTTTRNPAVAGLTESKEVALDRMTVEDCEKLIISKANLSENDSRSLSDDIEVIAKKCKGLPILANELGLKLKLLKKSIGVKKSIVQLKNDNLWEMQEFKEVFSSLKLNEPLLAPELKRCFAYCSLFPPTHKFKKEHLLQLWEVEGFIQPLQAGSSKQQIEQCFEDLLSRSILHMSCENRKQQVYTMHEINHEYAHLLGSNAFCRLGEGTHNLLPDCRNIRHLSLDCQNTDVPLLKMIEACEGLRTFLLLDFPKPKKRAISYNFFHNLQRLRLLDLSHTDIKHLPKPTFPSKHLRCLNLSYTLVTNLPDSLASLRSLQILKLKGCAELNKLPKDLNQLTSLTHLHVDMKELGVLPSNLGNLIKLEVLDSFFVGKSEGCTILELRSMEHLKKIHISGLENILDLKEAQDAMLIKKSLLRELTLEWASESIVETTNASDILVGLQPHNDLDNLILHNYHGLTFPEWLMSGSCRLVSIYLDTCPNCPLLPYLGELPHLENLVLKTFRSATSLDIKFCGKNEIAYPCLEFLEIRDMKSLASWTGLRAGDMPLLSALKIINCSVLVNLPSFEHMSCLMSLEIHMCEELMALPKLPSSLNAIGGELVITDSDLLTKSCKHGMADWQKIKDIAYVDIDGNHIPTKSLGHSQNEKDLDNANHASSSGMNGDQNIGRHRQYSDSSMDDYAHQDLDNVNHASSNGMNGDQNIGRRRQNSDSSIDVCKRESDAGNQKINEDSSSSIINHQIQEQGETNQSTAKTSTTQMPSNGNDKQVRNQGETNQSTATTSTAQMHSNGNGTRIQDQGETNQNTATTNTTQMPSNRHGTQGHPRSSKARSSSGLFGYLFGCFSKKHEEVQPSQSILPKCV